MKEPGTKVKEVVKNVEQMKISGIAKDNNVARIAVVEFPMSPALLLSFSEFLQIQMSMSTLSFSQSTETELTISASQFPKATSKGPWS